MLRPQPGLGSVSGVQPGIVGNRAVARLLQRYEAFEHARQGDHARGSQTITMPLRHGDTVANISLTSGEINALADLYESPDALEHADALELARLQALIARQLRGERVEESEWDDATGGRYNRLNLRNAPHFAARNTNLIDPGREPLSSENHRAYFVRYYNQTVVNAQGAYAAQIGLYDPAVRQRWLDRAVISAGFAEHFIMDAFSAGHLFSKDDFITVLAENLRQLGPAGVSNLMGAVARGVLADATSHALLGGYELTDRNIPWYIGGGWTGHPNLDSEAVFKGLLEHLYADTEGRQAVYSALVKVVHDTLSTNRNPDGRVGVMVENDFGRWVLSGDKTLDTSTDTQAKIDQALEEFRRQMQQYRSGPVTGTDPTADALRFMSAYFPRPTPETADFVRRQVRLVTNGAQGTIDALVTVMRRELRSILSALTDRGEIRRT
jgi:hypothetical protein